MRAELIVCTRDRAAEMEQLLANLPGQDRKPRLLVVDSSEGTETEELVERFAESGAWSDVTYLRSDPGLTVQRMCGVAALSPDCEIVHFLDDDVLLEPGYFRAIEDAFEADDEVVGIGGVITNQPPHQPRFLNRVFALDSHREGSVLGSGVNIKTGEVTDRLAVQWLSGCSMSYRRSLFETISFDTSMSGYSLGEDVDFSFAAGKLGVLLVIAAARLEHCEAGAGSLDQRRFWRDELIRRHRFVVRYRGQGVSPAAFWWSVYGDELVTVGKRLFLGDRARWSAKLSGMRDGIAAIRSERGDSAA